jgi:hypothetical protein
MIVCERHLRPYLGDVDIAHAHMSIPVSAIDTAKPFRQQLYVLYRNVHER